MACGTANEPVVTNSTEPNAPESTPQVSEEEEAKPKMLTSPMEVTMAAGSAGGASQVVGEAMGEAMRMGVEGTNFTYQPSQYGANVSLVNQGKVNVAMEGANAVHFAYQGGHSVYPEAHENVRVLAFVHNTAFSFALSKETGINSIQQIVDEEYPIRISVNTRDSIIEAPTRWVFEEYGITYQDIDSWGGAINFSASGDALGLVADRRLDGTAWTTQQPMSFYADLYAKIDANWLAPSEEAVDGILAKYDFTDRYVIPAGTYPGIDEDYHTFTSPMLLITNEDMTDDEAYSIVRSLHENLDYLHTANSVLQDMTAETIVPKIGVPLHPGAEAYYREAGLMD